MKQATISTCTFKKEFHSQKANATLYYYTITLSNGESGDVAVQTKDSNRIWVGNVINYEKTDKGIRIPSDGIVYQSPTNLATGSLDFPQAQPQNVVSPSTDKLHIVGIPTENTNQNIAHPFAQPKKNYGTKKPDEFIGFSYSYAKDLTVALIAQGDKEAIKNPSAKTIALANDIFNDILIKLNN